MAEFDVTSSLCLYLTYQQDLAEHGTSTGSCQISGPHLGLGGRTVEWFYIRIGFPANFYYFSVREPDILR